MSERQEQYEKMFKATQLLFIRLTNLGEYRLALRVVRLQMKLILLNAKTDRLELQAKKINAYQTKLFDDIKIKEFQTELEKI